MIGMNDYRGPFDPGTRLESFSRATLAALGREYMLFGHLLNAAGLPWVHIKLGAAAREKIAIELWMGASPVYTQRMQRALGFAGGDDVETIFKGLQLDVGFAHQYMDVRYRLDGDRGSFWLPSCGALLEVEPYGERQVRSMCHAIEDPTFDATAVATNPLARVRPIHRPPRLPADRVPHCEWTVFIEHGGEPVREIPLTGKVRATRLASFAFAPPEIAENGGGWPDYAGDVVEEPHLELFSRRALVAIDRELLVQDHLLVRAQMMALAEHADAALAREIALQQWIGAGAVASLRMRAALGLDGDDLDTILKVLQLHPAFVPGYARVALERAGERGLLRLDDCDALDEGDGFSWYALLDADPHAGLDAMVRAINPRASCRRVAPPAGARHAWEIVIDPSAEPAPEPPEVDYLKKTGTARFPFAVRLPVA